MKQKFRRFMAGFLAILTMFTTLFTNGTTAFAASSSANIAFWVASSKDHGVISEFNSRHTGSILYAMIDGHSAYCMNFGLSAKGGQLMSSDSNPNTNLSAAQEKLLAYCMYYGYSTTEAKAPTNDQRNKFIATQSMVWIIVNGIFGTSSADSAASKLCACAPDSSSSYSYYETLRDKINASYNVTRPSFASKTKSDATTYELKWNESNKRFDQMTNELVQMRKELQEMKEQQVSKSLKETLSEMVDRAQARCRQMKEKLFEVKEEMHNKAAEIVKVVKQKGKEALNKVSEFFGVKKKLESIRENVREGIVETDQTLARIDGFGEGMRMANEQLANSFRILAGKEQVDYSKKEYAQSNVAVIRKPWEWQKKVYQNLELHLDAAIDKVDNLAKDVELQRMEKKWDELYEQTHQESETVSIQPHPVALVSEKEYEYGADAFETYMKESKGEIKPEMKKVDVQKNEKAR